MQRSEDFWHRESAWKELRFSQTQRLSQKQSDKNRAIKLVVVMSAVDWWKCTRMRGLACDFARRVAWISARICGKKGRGGEASDSIQKRAHLIRKFPSRCSHLPHKVSG